MAYTPRPRIEPTPQQQPKLLQWQHQTLNLLHHKKTPKIANFLKLLFSEISFLQGDICQILCIYCGRLSHVGFILIISVYSWSNSPVSERLPGFWLPSQVPQHFWPQRTCSRTRKTPISTFVNADSHSGKKQTRTGLAFTLLVSVKHSRPSQRKMKAQDSPTPLAFEDLYLTHISWCFFISTED